MGITDGDSQRGNGGQYTFTPFLVFSIQRKTTPKRTGSSPGSQEWLGDGTSTYSWPQTKISPVGAQIEGL